MTHAMACCMMKRNCLMDPNWTCVSLQNPCYKFRETIDLGTTPKTKDQVREVHDSKLTN